MPTPTYDLIASNVLTTSATSVTFSSLPSTGYRDLIVVGNGVGAASQAYLYINNDTGSNYSYVFMRGDGSVTSSVSGTGTEGILTPSATFRNIIIQLFDYGVTDKHKPWLCRSNDAARATNAVAGRWANTAAITQIRLEADFGAGSSFYIYGIAA